MIGFILRFVGLICAVLLAGYLIPGFQVADAYSALLVALTLAILNVTIKPILSLVALPLTLITFGLFSFVINAALILLADYVILGFSVDGFVPALLGSVLIAVAGWALHRIL